MGITGDFCNDGIIATEEWLVSLQIALERRLAHTTRPDRNKATIMGSFYMYHKDNSDTPR